MDGNDEKSDRRRQGRSKDAPTGHFQITGREERKRARMLAGSEQGVLGNGSLALPDEEAKRPEAGWLGPVRSMCVGK